MRIRSGYSFRTAVGKLDDVLARVKEIGWSFAPLSDRLSTFGFTDWTKYCKDSKLHPVYGVELAVTSALGERKPIIDYWTFFAKTSLRQINHLIGMATDNPGREPSLLEWEALSVDGVIKIAGERLQITDNLKADPDFYVALAPSTSKLLYNEVKKAGLKFIASSDNYFTREGDLEFYRITLGNRASAQTYPQFILSDKELRAALSQFDKKDVDAAFRNRDKAFKQCNAELKKAELLVPEKKKTLRQLCEIGAKRTGTNLKLPVYKERLDRELKLIADKKYEDYFYIIADLIGWAKEKMIVGPARGSSCGSLVCYLLNITTIDPIPYNLIFERFIDVTREDLPDIDIDFSDVNRHLVFEYAEKKYGEDHVARLGTVMMFMPKSALKAAGAALRIPGWQIDKVLDGVLERSSGDARALLALEDTLNSTEAGRKLLDEYPEAIIASRLEGHPNAAGQHAAGIVITKEPVIEYVAIDNRTGSTMCDKYDAEKLNLLKIDALGLTQLSVFERTLELIGEKPISGWCEKNIPLNDKKAFAVLNKGHFAGVFQFNGAAVKSLATLFKIDRIDDIIALTALARPGPLATGGANSWVRRRSGEEEIESVHPLLAEVTKDTYGCVVYQETVMLIARRIGLLSWEDTADLRKGMSKSLGDEFFAKYWDKFRIGSKKNKLSEETAKEIWDQICTFGSWAFNKSHAVAYGMVSYWCCWFKAHHSIEFAAATLDSENDPARQIAILRELRDEGIDYVSVDAEQSTDRWTPGVRDNKRILIGPLTMIKGIGPKKVTTILDAKNNNLELQPSLKKLLLNARTEIDTLFPVADAVKRLWPDLAEAGIYSEVLNTVDVQPGVIGEVVFIGLLKRIAPLDLNEKQRVLKRGRELTGPTKAMNLFFSDDTGEIFCRVSPRQYDTIGSEVFERGKAGKALYAVKGTIPRDFRMMYVNSIKYLGDINDASRPVTEDV